MQASHNPAERSFTNLRARRSADVTRGRDGDHKPSRLVDRRKGTRRGGIALRANGVWRWRGERFTAQPSKSITLIRT
jgi:hypothetical protein